MRLASLWVDVLERVDVPLQHTQRQRDRERGQKKEREGWDEGRRERERERRNNGRKAPKWTRLVEHIQMSKAEMAGNQFRWVRSSAHLCVSGRRIISHVINNTHTPKKIFKPMVEGNLNEWGRPVATHFLLRNNRKGQRGTGLTVNRQTLITHCMCEQMLLAVRDPLDLFIFGFVFQWQSSSRYLRYRFTEGSMLNVWCRYCR